MEEQKYVIKNAGCINGFDVILKIPEQKDEDNKVKQEISSLMNTELMSQAAFFGTEKSCL